MNNAWRMGAFALVAVFAASGMLLAAPAPTVFYKTQDSDEWVAKNFVVQAKYERVIVVGKAEDAPKTISVAAIDLAGRSSPAPQEYPVAAVYATMQEAADAARGGDLVAVMPGTYAGFAIGDKTDAGDGKYIHFKALGKPGEVTIDRPAEGKDRNWTVMFQSAHHAILEGFNIAGATGPGMAPAGARAGIFIDGSFGPTGKMAHHIAIVGNFSHNHRSWGLHSTDSHTVLMQDNCFALSCQEHSAYVSDGSDNYCIRRNVFFSSFSSGLQCNLDPDASMEELLRNDKLAAYGPEQQTKQWALGLIKLATENFGENNFPDGRGLNFIIEDNVIYGNGKNGGGSFNFAALQDSLIQNNLVYENYTTGIAEWDNANSFDTTAVDPGPQAGKDVTGPEALPFFGCHGNVIRNNTVIMNNPERSGMLLGNGSWGNVIRNNIFLNDEGTTLEAMNTSIYRLDSGWNVLRTTDYNGMDESLLALAVNLDEKNRSLMNVTRDMAAAEFVKFNMEPWVIIEGSRWRLNPDRPDFHPKAGSKLFSGWGDESQLPGRDIEGKARKHADIGAYAALEAASDATLRSSAR